MRTSPFPRCVSTSLVAAAVVACLAVDAVAQVQRQWATARAVMVETDIATAGIKQPAILAVMRTAPRHEFVPAELRQYAYFDMALPIGEHQTISPPFIVAWMTQMLDPQPTDRVLEIGTGSGYQAAVLAGLAKEVDTIEINKPLAKRAAETFKRLGYKNISAKVGDGYQGWPEHAPFDKIIVTCSPEKVPGPLVEQLREGGRIVIPLGERYQQTLYALVKHDGRLKVEAREPTFFVPMTGKAETLRGEQASEPVTELVNGDFETEIESGKPAGWYYVRQAELETEEFLVGIGRYLKFTNRVPGRGAQALQAIGVDGRSVAELTVHVRVRAGEITPGQSNDQQAKMLVSFFDENRSPVGEQVVGPWTGSFNWSRRSARLKVPSQARVAIVAVGLLGATGELACDEIEVKAANSRVAKR